MLSVPLTGTSDPHDLPRTAPERFWGLARMRHAR